MKKNISYDIHSHSISETLVSLCIAHSFSPSVGESLESFAFGWCKSSDSVTMQCVLLHSSIKRLSDSVTNTTTPSL